MLHTADIISYPDNLPATLAALWSKISSVAILAVQFACNINTSSEHKILSFIHSRSMFIIGVESANVNMRLSGMTPLGELCFLDKERGKIKFVVYLYLKFL